MKAYAFLVLTILTTLSQFGECKNDELKTVSPPASETNFQSLVNELAQFKVEQFVKKYNQNNRTMSVDEVSKFANSLFELLSIKPDEHLDHDHDHHEHEDNHDEHKHGHNHKSDSDHTHDHDHHDPIKKYECFKMSLLNITANNDTFSNYSSICSFILTTVDQCYLNGTKLTKDNQNEKSLQWMFAFLCAFIISVIGVLSYLIVPSLNTLCFNYLFQFLVALAVGTLSGDSFLHLIPHAFESHDHDHGHSSDDSSHTIGVFKGLGAMVGIYTFFIIEKIMQMRRAKKEKMHKKLELEAMKQHKFSNHMEMNEHSHHHHHHNHNQHQHKDDQLKPIDNQATITIGANDLPFEDQSCLVIHANKDLKYISQYLPNNKCDESVDHHDHEHEKEHLHQHSNNTTTENETSPSTKYQISSKSDTSYEARVKLLDDQNNPCSCTSNMSIKLKTNLDNSDEHLNKMSSSSSHSERNSPLKHSHRHGHGHSHKHSHIYKSSREKAHHDHHLMHEREINDIKLIAWMVIMGDGLHNFSDGLAIGAAFTSNLTTGFGTAIAVLCHELPHEIGDFAVLRRAGVSLKRALVFNVISGILCMIGVFFGLLIGGFPLLKNWSFLFIAGTFLYISLVDMIPELSENKEDDSFLNFSIQSIGILVGIGIMLSIALFEDHIKQIFS